MVVSGLVLAQGIMEKLDAFVEAVTGAGASTGVVCLRDPALVLWAPHRLRTMPIRATGQAAVGCVRTPRRPLRDPAQTSTASRASG